MKAQAKTAILLIVLMISCSVNAAPSFLQKSQQLTFDRDYFQDYWIGSGYGCAGKNNIDENVNILYDGNIFKAVKVNGDPCVQEGEVSFQGNIQNSYNTNNNIPAIITLGSPQRPQSSKQNTQIKIVDLNNFTIPQWNLKFRRVNFKQPKPMFENNYFLGYWIGSGYSCKVSNIDEDVVIRYENGNFIATKVKGDECVTTGMVTFTGAIPQNLNNYSNYPVVITVGSPQNPGSGKINGTVRIVDINNFTVSAGLKFRRTDPPAPKAPQFFFPSFEFDCDYLNGRWLVVGYCDDLNIRQNVDITYDDNDVFSITKDISNGDGCIRPGQTFVTGNVPTGFSTNIPYDINLTLGYPTKPESIQKQTFIIVRNYYYFEIPQYKIYFIRRVLVPRVVEKIIEKPVEKIQYVDKIVEKPVEKIQYVDKIKAVIKTVPNPECIDYSQLK
jgi:hypothetical protein